MQPKKLFLIGFLLSVITLNAQTDLNAYKYVTIPNRFDFQKSDDAYQVNSLLKFLFNKKGFEAFLTNEIFPIDFKTNPCLSLNAKVVDESNMFRTKVYIELYNCQNQLVLKSELGESREKELKRGFQEAVRIAFTTIENIPYKFTDDKRIKDIIVLPEIKNTINEPVKASQEVIQVDEIPVPEKNEVAAMTDKKYQDKVVVIAENAAKINTHTLAGSYKDETQVLHIAKQGNQYILSDAKHNIMGIVYPTSQSNYFIIKWLQGDDNVPKLAFLNQQGNLVIDVKETSQVYKRF